MPLSDSLPLSVGTAMSSSSSWESAASGSSMRDDTTEHSASSSSSVSALGARVEAFAPFGRPALGASARPDADVEMVAPVAHASIVDIAMTRARQLAELVARGYVEEVPTPGDIAGLEPHARAELVRDWLVRMNCVDRERRRAYDATHYKIGNSVLVPSLSGLVTIYSCACDAHDFGAKRRAIEHIIAKHACDAEPLRSRLGHLDLDAGVHFTYEHGALARLTRTKFHDRAAATDTACYLVMLTTDGGVRDAHGTDMLTHYHRLTRAKPAAKSELNEALVPGAVQCMARVGWTRWDRTYNGAIVIRLAKPLRRFKFDHKLGLYSWRDFDAFSLRWWIRFVAPGRGGAIGLIPCMFKYSTYGRCPLGGCQFSHDDAWVERLRAMRNRCVYDARVRDAHFGDESTHAPVSMSTIARDFVVGDAQIRMIHSPAASSASSSSAAAAAPHAAAAAAPHAAAASSSSSTGSLITDDMLSKLPRYEKRGAIDFTNPTRSGIPEAIKRAIVGPDPIAHTTALLAEARFACGPEERMQILMQAVQMHASPRANRAGYEESAETYAAARLVMDTVTGPVGIRMMAEVVWHCVQIDNGDRLAPKQDAALAYLVERAIRAGIPPRQLWYSAIDDAIQSREEYEPPTWAAFMRAAWVPYINKRSWAREDWSKPHRDLIADPWDVTVDRVAAPVAAAPVAAAPAAGDKRKNADDNLLYDDAGDDDGDDDDDDAASTSNKRQKRSNARMRR